MNATRYAAALLLLTLAGCRTAPNVPKQVIVAVPEYRPLPEWIAPVPVYQRSGSTVADHLTAECRHKLDQQLANCRIGAARRIVAGEAVEPGICALDVACGDGK